MNDHPDTAQLDKIYVILKGNGDPQKGMVWKVDELYKWMQQHKEVHKDITTSQQREKDALDARKWDIIRMIINWLMPVILYGIAYLVIVKSAV